MMDENEIVKKMEKKLDDLEGDWALELFVRDGLAALMNNQRVVSSPVEGCVPEEGKPPSGDAIRTYSLALIVETTEFLQTLPWKTWKDTTVDKARVCDEFADMLAFLGVILLQLEAMGITPKDLADAYLKKSVINVERFLGRRGIDYRRIGNGRELP